MLNPNKSFVKRVIAEEGDQVRIVYGRVFVNDVPMQDDFVPPSTAATTTSGRRSFPRAILRDGRPPEQQFRQPPLGLRAEEVHHRPRAAALVAHPDRARVLRRDQDRYDAVLYASSIAFSPSISPSLSSRSCSATRSRAVSILSDGFHSLTDDLQRRGPRGRLDCAPPARRDHPYGHRKYETMASLGILVFLVIVLVQVLSAAYDRLVNGGTPRVFPEGIGIMTATLIVNLFVVS